MTVLFTYVKIGIFDNNIANWSTNLGANSLMTEICDDDEDIVRFAERWGFRIERHSYQSILDMASYDDQAGRDFIQWCQADGIRYVTLANEPGETSERKLYELYIAALVS